MTESEKSNQFVEDFMSSLRDYGNYETIFNILPDIYFYIKDSNFRWVLCNDATLKLFNLKERSEIIGKTEYDFFPKKVADAIRADDTHVIQNKGNIIDRAETIVDETGHLVWVSTSKLPLYGSKGEVRGLIGTTRILKRSDKLPPGYQQFYKAIEFIKQNYQQNIDVKELANLSFLSDSQFRKRFRQLFKMPPQQFILKIRLQAACHKLSASNEPISEIALQCGFCDQSYFTRQFRNSFDVSPKKYRDTWNRRFLESA